MIESRCASFQPGDLVTGLFGWQEYALVAAAGGREGLDDATGVVSGARVVPPSLLALAPATAALSVLGMTGLSAYFGLLDKGQPKAGESCLVTGASGAVGQIAGQIARIKGCSPVVGVAGSDEACRALVERYGFDAAVNHRTCGPDLSAVLRKHFPRGIDIVFDNVGGEWLNAALSRINHHARIVLCGAIANYNATRPEDMRGPSNFTLLIPFSATASGFIVFNYARRFPAALQDLAQWVADGRLRYGERVVDGLEQAPTALNSLFASGVKVCAWVRCCASLDLIGLA